MNERLKRGFRMGAFRVDPLSGLVSGPSGSHHVQPKVIDVLLCLAERGGRLVERDEVIECVWRRATSEEVLTRCISELRSVLGDNRGTPRYIQTVPKRGYRLLEPVFPLDDDQPGVGGQPVPQSPLTAFEPAPLSDGRAGLTVLLIDDHPLFREGMKLQMREHDESIECLEAGTIAEALAFVGRQVDLILLDFTLPDVDGLEAIATMRRAFTAPVTIVSARDDPHTIKSAIARGAVGFIPKSMSKKELFAALGLVQAGAVFLPPQVLFGAPSSQEALTELQHRVLNAVVRGKLHEAVAAELDMTAEDVETHLHRAYRTLGVDNRIDAVYELAKRGLRLA